MSADFLPVPLSILLVFLSYDFTVFGAPLFGSDVTLRVILLPLFTVDLITISSALQTRTLPSDPFNPSANDMPVVLGPDTLAFNALTFVGLAVADVTAYISHH